MTKWEYLVVEIRDPNSESTIFIINGGERQYGDQWYAANIPYQLNKLGQEGWELINIGKGNLTYHAMYTFKRPILDGHTLENE
jgi:hypothetical protein